MTGERNIAGEAWAAELTALLNRLRAGAVDPLTGRRPTFRVIAARAGYSHSHVHDVFHGRRQPTADAIDAIVGALAGGTYDHMLARHIVGQLSSSVSQAPYQLHGLPPATMSPSLPRDQFGRASDGWLPTENLVGHEASLRDLRLWRDSHDRIAVHLMHAGYGVGKTRLVAEHARCSERAQWTVLRALDLTQMPADRWPDSSRRTGSAGTLIVVDDADTWAPAHAIALINRAGQQEFGRVRLLLSARRAGQWWQVLVRRASQTESTFSDSALGPATASAEERRAMFTAAVDWYACAFGVNDRAAIQDVADAADTLEDHALSIHVAAMNVVNDALRSPARSDVLSKPLLDREWQRWAAWHDAHPSAISVADLRRITLLACLIGPVSYDRGLAAAIAVGIRRPSQSIDEHGFNYPSVGGASVLEPLRPPCVAQDLIGRCASGRDPSAARMINCVRGGTAGSDLMAISEATTAAAASRWGSVAAILAHSPHDVNRPEHQ